MSKSHLRAGFITAALIGASVAMAAPATAACKEKPVHGNSVGTFKSTASLAARANWRSKVRKRYGYKWAYWSKARKSATICNKNKNSRWSCVARANPCA